MDRSRTGTTQDMSNHERRRGLDEVIAPEEGATPDHREHAKTPHPPDDEELERRAQREREQTGAGGPLREDG